MPKRSSGFSCKINKKYYEALVPDEIGTHTTNRRLGEYGTNTYWVKANSEIYLGSRYRDDRETQCCGLEELSFLSFNNYANNVCNLSNSAFEELIARKINVVNDGEDHRVYFVGLPITVSRDDSAYNVQFYRRLYKTLLKFGFKRAGRAYRNANSGNTLVVLVGQR